MAIAERTTNTKHAEALELLSYDLALIPIAWPEAGGCGCGRPGCRAIGKHPLIGDWPNKWTQDINQIDQWLKRWPKMNVGIVTGYPSGVVVLDVDGPEGEESLRKLEAEHGPLPDTWEALTGGGGRHIFFKCPANVSELKNAVKFLPGLDIRADGGQVVAPGSLHSSGAYYQWELSSHPAETELAEMPAWLFAVIRDYSQGGAGKRKKYPKEGPILDGQRNDYLAHFAGKLRRIGCSEGVLLAALLAENEARCQPPLPDDEVKGIAKSISRYPPGDPKSSPEEDFEEALSEVEGADRDLPVVSVSNRFLASLSGDALEALKKANEPPVIFNRSGGLVEVIKIQERDKYNQTTTRPNIKPLNESALRGHLARSAHYVKAVKKGGKVHQYLPTFPPLEVARDILSLGEWDGLPLLRGVVQAPTMRWDGSLHSAPGYDPVTGLYYVPEPGFKLPHIADRPGTGEIQAALDTIKDIIIDFPFAEEASQANTLAAIITLVVRNLINGNVPLLLIDKPSQGTGASLLADVIALLGTGETAHMTTAPEGRGKEEEMRKRITSILSEGRLLAVIDNVEGIFQSPTLCSLLTSKNWTDRLLGYSRTVTLQSRTVWIATGNNLKLAGDLPRRCYKIRLDAKHARPWQRDPSGFKHPRLLEYVKDNRGDLLAAVFTLARAWIQAGRPTPRDAPIMGSFEEWREVVGGILEHAGVKGFLENVDELYEKSEMNEGIEGFLEACYGIWGTQGKTAREIRTAIDFNPELADALPLWLDITDKGFTRKLGNLFSRHEGKHFTNGLKLEKAGTRQGAVLWCISQNGTIEELLS